MKLVALFASTGTTTAVAVPAWDTASQLPAGSPLSVLGIGGLLLITWYSERWRAEHRTGDSEPATLHSTSRLVAEQS